MEREKDPARKKKLRRYLISSFCAAFSVALFSQIRGFAFENALKENLSALCDGFFVSGVLFGGLGAMVWVSTTGFFDILGYGFKNLAVLIPFHHRRKYKHFYEYKAEQSAKRTKPQLFLLIIGLVLIAAAAILLNIYSAV